MINLIIIILVAFILILTFRKDYIKGLALSIFFQLLLPRALDIRELNIGFLITSARVIILILLINWILNKNIKKEISKVLFIRLFSLLIISNLLTTLLAYEFTVSFKQLITICTEEFLFYIIIATSLKTERDIKIVLFYACISLGIVGLLGFYEKYARINPLTYFSILTIADARVESTYPHPILFGIGMAMGWNLSLLLIDIEKDKRKKILLWIVNLIIIGGCYFSKSRGAWFSALLGASIIFWLSSFQLKKKLIYYMFLGIALLILNTGVYLTINRLIDDTFNPDSAKGRTAQYRMELWKKAYREVNKSFKRFALGYGIKNHQIIDLQEYDTEAANISLHYAHFESWDNHYAATIFDTGFIGFFLFIILHFYILIYLLVLYRKSPLRYRKLLMFPLVIIIIMIFAMTNVYMFSPQLNFLFWTSVAIINTIFNLNRKAIVRQYVKKL